MIEVSHHNLEGECQHCHKTRCGAFHCTVNGRILDLCWKCLANLCGLFGEQPDRNGKVTA